MQRRTTVAVLAAALVLGGASSLNSQMSLGSVRGVPLVLDYDGDGKADTALWDGLYWHIRLASTIWQSGPPQIPWGSSGLGDLPFAGDFDSDGLDDLAVFRSADYLACWYVRSTATGQQLGPIQFGRGQPWSNLPLVVCPVYGG